MADWKLDDGDGVDGGDGNGGCNNGGGGGLSSMPKRSLACFAASCPTRTEASQHVFHHSAFPGDSALSIR